MAEQKPLVKNAGDPKQVKDAKKTERFNQMQREDDMRFLLKLPQFRRYVWRHLEYANVFASIWVGSAEIHRLAGRQEFGQIMLAEVCDADPDAFVQMMKENKWAVEKEKEEAETKPEGEEQ